MNQTMHQEKLKQLIFISILATAGIVCKPVFSPMINFITDFMRIPGGSMASGISMSVLILGALLYKNQYVATKMAFLQGLIALIFGISSFQGLFVLVSYTLPGFVIDSTLKCTGQKGIKEEIMSAMAGVMGILSGALVTNAMFFKMPFVPLSLFLLVGAGTGYMASNIALQVSKKLKPILKIRGEFYEQ